MRRNAHTLAELVVVVLIMGILAYIALPRLQFQVVQKRKLEAASNTLMADLRRTRSMALRDAATNNKGFELQMTGHPYSGYQIDDLNSHVTVDTWSVDSSISISANLKYDFGPLGNVTTGAGTPIVLSADGRSYTISFVAATGAVVCTEN